MDNNRFADVYGEFTITASDNTGYGLVFYCGTIGIVNTFGSVLAEFDADDIPAAKVIPLSEVFRCFSGHSNYHGDKILSALTCIAEGKEVSNVATLEDNAPVKHGKWMPNEIMSRHPYARNYYCSVCKNSPVETGDYCNKCGAKMDGGMGNE